MASTQITFYNNTTVAQVEFAVTWALSPIGKCVATPQSTCSVGCEYVWYDVAAYNKANGLPLARLKGVYGSHSVTLINVDGAFILIDNGSAAAQEARSKAAAS